MSNLPKWMQNEETTRKRSGKQEKRLSKEFGGRTTCNSGAKFGENDVVTPDFEIEAKTTKNKQYPLKLAELEDTERKAGVRRTGMMVIQFEQSGREFVVIDKGEFLRLTNTTENEI
jgi:hypothetical protein